jgi:hypothetical protein
VTLSTGADNVTRNAHVAWRDAASIAVHVTGVDPSLKLDPDGGVQEILIGEIPPLTVGLGNETACEVSVMPRTVTSGGHESRGGSPEGVGLVVRPPHAAKALAVNITRRTKQRFKLVNYRSAASGRRHGGRDSAP